MAGKPRREWRTGSIYRHKDRWRVSVSLGSDAFGKRVRKEWQCRSAKAAHQKLEEVQRRLRVGLPAEESRVSVAVYAQDWLAAVKPTVRPTTYDQYESLTRNHIVTAFGHLPLVKVGPPDLRRLMASMAANGYASRTIRGVVDCMRMLSRQALHDGILSRNVAELVQKPKLEQKEPRHFTAEQARRFLEVAKDDELSSLFAVALGTGLRRGELLGLTWRDVDLDQHAVTVRRSKTSAGVRVVPLPDFAARELAATHERHPGPIWSVSPSWVSHLVPRLCDAAGLPRLTFHELRHSTASILADEGVDWELIRQIIGHTRMSMTARYARAGDDLKRQAMEKLGRAVGG